MPRADSTSEPSTSCSPTTAFRRIGSAAKNVTTMTDGATPNPANGISRPTRAN